MNNGVSTIRTNMSVLAMASALAFLPFSIKLCHASLIMYMVLWLTEGKWNEKVATFKQDVLLQVLGCWMLLMLIGIFQSENQSDGLFAVEKKIFFFLLPACIATSSVKFGSREIRTLFYSFTAVCFGTIIFCLTNSWLEWTSFQNGAQSFEAIDFLNSSNYFANHPDTSRSWAFFTYLGLSKGVDLHPAYLSLYLGFCVIFLITEKSQPQLFRFHHHIIVFVIAIFLFALVLLSTRIIILGTALSLAGWIFYEFRNHYSWKRLALFIAVLACFLSGVFLNPISRYRNWDELTNMSYEVREETHYHTSTEIRASLWWLGWKSFQEVHPIWGAGTGDVQSIMTAQGKAHGITNVLSTYDPHNQFLHILIANGIAGAFLFCFVIIRIFTIALRERQILLLLFTALFTLLCMTESALELQKGIVFFAIITALLAYTHQPVKVTRSTTPTILVSARS